MNNSPPRYINLNRYLDLTLAEGPGKRFCLWVQGCLRHCANCCNAHMQPIEPRLLLEIDEICDLIRQSRSKNEIEGITFLGGEPLLQAKGLARIADFSHGLGLSVMLFTGYRLEECTEDDIPGIKNLLTQVDVLVDGPFIERELDERRNWIGSVNQNFHYLTDVYNSSIETDPLYHGLVEIRLQDNLLLGNGCPKAMSPIPIGEKYHE